MNPKIVLLYAFGGRQHEIGFSVSDTQFNSYLAQTNPAFVASGQSMANNLKGVVSDEVSFFAVRLKNTVGAIVREATFTAIPGTYAANNLSNSATFGLGYLVPATGLAGKASSFTSFLYLGHSDWHTQGTKRIVAGTIAQVTALLAVPFAGIPVAKRDGTAGTARGYVTVHWNTREQDIAGS